MKMENCNKEQRFKVLRLIQTLLLSKAPNLTTQRIQKKLLPMEEQLLREIYPQEQVILNKNIKPVAINRAFVNIETLYNQRENLTMNVIIGN